MPLPFIVGAVAVAAGAVGVGSGVKGAAKMKEANETMKAAESRHKRNITQFEEQSESTSKDMDKLGQKELEILKSFDEFSKVFEKIKGKPEFKTYIKDGVDIPKYDAEELKQVSVGAGILLGGISGAAVGTAGGFAAAGATTSAVMALGTASTGTAIASLSGAAATNATLAALGGGAIAAGGGGIALGTTILGAATLGVGLLVGGVIFNVTGSSLSAKADEAWSQMKNAEDEILKICSYLQELKKYSNRFYYSLSSINRTYKDHIRKLNNIVETLGKTEWSIFTQEEKMITENTALLVQVLFNMCKVKLVIASNSESEMNKVNSHEIDKTIENTDRVLREKELIKGF